MRDSDGRAVQVLDLVRLLKRGRAVMLIGAMLGASLGAFVTLQQKVSVLYVTDAFVRVDKPGALDKWSVDELQTVISSPRFIESFFLQLAKERAQLAGRVRSMARAVLAVGKEQGPIEVSRTAHPDYIRIRLRLSDPSLDKITAETLIDAFNYGLAVVKKKDQEDRLRALQANIVVVEQSLEELTRQGAEDKVRIEQVRADVMMKLSSMIAHYSGKLQRRIEIYPWAQTEEKEDSLQANLSEEYFSRVLAELTKEGKVEAKEAFDAMSQFISLSSKLAEPDKKLSSLEARIQRLQERLNRMNEAIVHLRHAEPWTVFGTSVLSDELAEKKSEVGPARLPPVATVVIASVMGLLFTGFVIVLSNIYRAIYTPVRTPVGD